MTQANACLSFAYSIVALIGFRGLMLPRCPKSPIHFKAIEKEGLQGGGQDKMRVGHHRHVHDPGIQQEP